MTRPVDPMSHAVDVNWDDPKLQDLLKKIEGLRLDNRNTFHARWVRMRQGWLLADAHVPWHPALLVLDDHQGGLVLQTHAEIVQAGDPVAVDLTLEGMAPRVVFGEVARSRPGLRPEDQGQTVYFAWVQILK